MGDLVYLYNTRRQAKLEEQWIPGYRIVEFTSQRQAVIKEITKGSKLTVNIKHLRYVEPVEYILENSSFISFPKHSKLYLSDESLLDLDWAPVGNFHRSPALQDLLLQATKCDDLSLDPTCGPSPPATDHSDSDSNSDGAILGDLIPTGANAVASDSSSSPRFQSARPSRKRVSTQDPDYEYDQVSKLTRLS